MDNKLVLIILAVLLAPVAVFLKKGAGKDLVINIVLCFYFIFQPFFTRCGSSPSNLT